MFYSYKCNHYAINLDWLSFNVRIPEPEPEIVCPDGYRIEMYDGNNIYRHRMMIYDNTGCKLMTCLWCPYSKKIPSLIMTVQIANSQLYEVGRIAFCYNLLLFCLDCEYNSCSRLDFCCDFQATDRHLGVIRRLGSSACYIQGKKEGSKFWHETTYKGKKTTFPHCLSWGSKTSEIRCKLYNKSREQGVDTDGGQPAKPYIVSQWVDLGLDIRAVWRLEFSITGAGQLRYEGRLITLDDICNPTWVAGVWFNMYVHRFIVRRNSGGRNGHHNTDAVVTFLDVDMWEFSVRWKEPDSHRLPDADIVTQFRSLLRTLETRPVMANADVFDRLADTLRTYVYSVGFDAYCVARLGCSIDEYIDRLRDHVGTGEFDAVPVPSMTWD